MERQTENKEIEKTDIETLLAAVDQQLLVKLLDSLIREQIPGLKLADHKNGGTS